MRLVLHPGIFRTATIMICSNMESIVSNEIVWPALPHASNSKFSMSVLI